MDRSALVSAAPQLFSGKTRQKQSRNFFYQPSEWNRRQATTAKRFRRRRILVNSLRISSLAVLVSLSATTILLVQSYQGYARLVDARLARGYLTTGAGIYAAPRTLRRNQKLTREGLAATLRRAGYIESVTVTEVWNGSFTVSENAIEIRPAVRESSPSLVQVKFDRGGRIAELTGDEVTLDSFTLAPESLTSDTSGKGAVRRQLTFKEIPPVLIKAITSIEDRRFFDHHGVDFFGVARALVRNAGDERIGQGGSSITQQLVKNTYLTPERTLRRKYAEAMLAFSLERRLSKEDIFALYCNEVYLGQRDIIAVRGVDQAARVYFGKELKDLSLTEAATIAGMIQSPSRYSPIAHSDETRLRRNTVLGTMVRDGRITLEQAAAAAKEPLLLADFNPACESSAPYFLDYVNRYRSSRDSERVLSTECSSAPVVTTLDLDLQRFAESAIQKELARLDETYKGRNDKPQAALVALDPRTGEVLAMIGGRDYAESQLNRATDAKRQPGSVFKPFVYAAALESGMSPLQNFTDAPQQFSYGTSKYSPTNFGGRFSMRDVPMRDGLINSLNVVTVNVAMQTGLARTANVASDFGLPRPLPYPALALGTTEATPLQVAAAYATFANGGNKIAPRVDPSTGIQAGQQIIQPSTAFIVTDMLQGVIDHGTGRSARALQNVAALAGKTGTSRDGWFVGYSPNLVCAVWVGFDNDDQLGLTGGEAALPIWIDFMKAALDARPELGGKSFTQPDDVSIVEVDPDSDELATPTCPSHETVAILTAQVPSSECFRHNTNFDSSDQSIDATAPAMIASAFAPRRRQPQLPASTQTRIDIDVGGRKTLVSEMVLGR
jgi:penicillin-binding protein 1B